MEDALVRLRNQGESLIDTKRYAEAEIIFRQIIADASATAGDYNDLGRALQNQGQSKYADASDQYAKAHELWKKEGSDDQQFALWNWANSLRLRKELSQAEGKCREAIQAHPSYADNHDLLGSILTDQGKAKFPDAIRQFARADELWRQQGSKERTEALRHWANVLRTLNKLTEAEAKYREAISVDAECASAHNLLGLTLQDQGPDKYPAAIECFEKAAALWKKQKSDSEKYALSNIAETMRLMQRFPEAERKCREAIAKDGDYVAAYIILGRLLGDQGKDKHPAATAAFAKAELLSRTQHPVDRREAITHWGYLLEKEEDYEQALEKHRLAAQADPDDFWSAYNLGNALANCGLYQEALDAYERAIAKEPSDPYSYHNKAYYLFYLGQYGKGWEAWTSAKAVYEKCLQDGVQSLSDINRATHLASVLREQYVDREGAEHWYRALLTRTPNHHTALSGLALLYFEWSKSEKPSPAAIAQLSFAIKKAMGALKARLGTGDAWQNAMDLANFCVDTEDFVAAADWLATAEAACGDSVSRRAEVASRYGVLHAKREQFDKAIERFQFALCGDPSDLKKRTNLAEAYLKAKQLPKAEEEYRKVLAVAPGNIEALIGSAQLCIELAESGDSDRCAQAEKHLGAAIHFGAQSEAGSKRLAGKELAQVYYLRGYVRVKRYESDGASVSLSLLKAAEDDFDRCRKLDRTNHKADAALEKLRKKLRATQRDKVLDVFGPLVVCVAATAVFIFVQLDFFFHGREPFGLDWFKTQKVKETGYYALLSFGAILFMVAGLYLPKVLKLKVGVIELEKGTVEQISTPTSLGISR